MVAAVRTTSLPCLTGEQGQKTPGRTVIAHISDLHFTSMTDTAREDVWSALIVDLSQHKVDLLVATGDLIDSSGRDNYREKGVRQAFAKAKAFLLSLCEAGGIDDPSRGLYVVPGNHDFRVKGILTPESKIALLKKAKQWFLSPHYDLFNEYLGEFYRPVFLPNLRCCLFTFDSNAVESGLVLATGRVDNNKIIEFTNLCDLIHLAQPDVWSQCTKIALLHHHPMPIGATERESGRVEDESYLLLKNAGLFMSELVRRKVDLILHGHKHYPALSRATFPRPGEEPHTVSVVAAGSASTKGRPHTSYNLITIHNNGTISVERRIREELAYDKGPSFPSIQSYEDTRRARFARLARELRVRGEVGVRVKVRKYTRVDTIKPGSGDDEMSGHLEDVVAAYGDGQSPTRLPWGFSSRSGVPGRPRLHSHTHALSWVEPDATQKGTGYIVFDRPVADSPMSFTYRGTISNAIHSNAQDRLAVTGEDDKESVHATITEWYDMFTLKVKFPDSFDRRPRVQVVDEVQKVRDHVEERYAARRFTSFRDDNTAVLIVDRPLPGYKYKIVWDLPVTEDEELNLSGADRLRIEEIKERLLDLRSEAGADPARRMSDSLAGLKAYINALPIGAADLEIALHVHDPNVGGLVCAAVLDSAAAQEETLSRVIHAGDSAIGQAYRRREHVNWVRGQNQGDDLADFFEYDDALPHAGILSVPLFYPMNGGGKVMVVTLATRLRVAPMLSFLEGQRSAEGEAAFKVLVSKIHSWYAQEMMSTLGLPEITEPAPRASGGGPAAADPG
jgi:3',5'-cyclic AMP phosphodiesterase CpdA